MFSKLIALLFLFFITYILSVFLLPNMADQYGDKILNTQIRVFKMKLDNLGGTGASTKSLIDSAKDIATPYIQETQKVASGIDNTIDQKIKEAQKAAQSVQNAYKAVEEATEDISKVTTFSTGIVK